MQIAEGDLERVPIFFVAVERRIVSDGERPVFKRIDFFAMLLMDGFGKRFVQLGFFEIRQQVVRRRDAASLFQTPREEVFDAHVVGVADTKEEVDGRCPFLLVSAEDLVGNQL